MPQDPPTREDRYVRQEQWARLGSDGQRRVRAATVLVVGAGGLGSWLVEMLARMGVGRLRLADADRVDWTNLARQALYTEADVGRLKVEAAADRLAAINSDVAVAAVAAFEAAMAVRILAGSARDLSRRLTKMDLWTAGLRQIGTETPAAGCPCCGHRRFEYLETQDTRRTEGGET